MENATKQKVKKIVSIVANVLVWVFVAFSILVTVLVFTAQGSEDGVPSLFGKSLISVSTDSMEETFYRGDLLLLEKLEDSEKLGLATGTIITYKSPVDLDGDGNKWDINTHRIVAVDGDYYITQGDNKATNPVPDNVGKNGYRVHYTYILGTVEEDARIGGLGGVIAFLRSSLGFFLCIVLPLVLFFLYELYHFISLLVTERAKRASAGASTLDEEEIRRRAIEEYLRAQKTEEEKKTDDTDGAADQNDENK